MDNLQEENKSEGLSQRVKKGTQWVFIGHISLNMLSLSAMIVLARLLSPEDFGVVAIAMVVLEMIKLFGEMGIASKLIQQPDEIEKYASAAFWLNILIATCLSILTVIVAPFAASFYANELVSPILMLLGLGFLLNSFGSVHSALLIRELDFKRRTLIDIVIGLLTKTVTIGMAIMGFGVWSLVVPQILSSPVQAFALWRICPWRPKFEFNFSCGKEIYHFGKYMLGAGMMRYLSLNADYMIIGKLLGVFELGVYRFAYMVAHFPVDHVVRVVGRVSFPAFSKLQNDLNRFREAFLRMTRLLSLISFPLFLGMVPIAQEFVPLVFGEKWNGAIIPLQIIICFALIRSFVSPCGQIVVALGRPRIEFIFNLVQAPLLITGVLIGAKYGIIGVAIAMSFLAGMMSFIFLKVSINLIHLRLRNILGVIYPALLSSLLMMIFVFWIRNLLFELGYKEHHILFACVPIGAIIYFGILRTFFRSSFEMLWNLFKDVAGNQLALMKKAYPAYR